MVDTITYIVSVVGIIAAMCYLFLTECLYGSKKKSDPKFIADIQASIKDKNGLDSVLKNYEIANREIERRENITLLIGSILITGSILVLGNTAKSENELATPIYIYAVTSILLFVLWLFVLHCTSRELDNLAYSYVKDIEEALSESFGYRFGIHRYLYSKTHKNNKTVWWLRVRRFFWGFVLILLSIAWLLVSVSRLTIR